MKEFFTLLATISLANSVFYIDEILGLDTKTIWHMIKGDIFVSVCVYLIYIILR